MRVYADYSFYIDDYLCGRKEVLNLAGYIYYARAASLLIQKYAGGNINEDDVPDCVKMCCCELAEFICKNEQLRDQQGMVSSESVGGWSRSYESTEVRNAAIDKNTHDIIYKWLSGTGLLYRGVR
ncbi:hypothetical protein Osc1_05040 [Hominimerdicola sp. 21CYCFAH17_S]